jgi:hypothetical protein
MVDNQQSGYESARKIAEEIKQRKPQKNLGNLPKFTPVNPIENIDYRKYKLPAPNKLGFIAQEMFNGELTINPEKIGSAMRQFKSRDIQELPKEVKPLIHNPMFMPRYKKLAREYSVDYLIKLAELVRNDKGVNFKQNYFAKCCSIKQWEKQTKPMLDKLFEKIDQARKVLSQLGVSTTNKYFYYKLSIITRLSEYQLSQLIKGINHKWASKYNKEKLFTRWALQYLNGEVPVFVNQKYNHKYN